MADIRVFLAALVSASILAAACDRGGAPSVVRTTGTPEAAAPSPTPHPFAQNIPFTACKLLANPAGATAQDIFAKYGPLGYCSQDPLIISVPGTFSGDLRPGFLVCEGPEGPHCGVGPGSPSTSQLANWQFYPFPSSSAQEVGFPAWAQLYQCVGDGVQLWAFHLDSFTYTSGCRVPPQGVLTEPCDLFLFAPSGTTLYFRQQYGRTAGCGKIGNVIVGVLDGKPKPGLVVCDGSSAGDKEPLNLYCGLRLIDQQLAARWRFIPLPVAAGPVDSAVFDAAGKACVQVGAQRFSFDAASFAVSTGCP